VIGAEGGLERRDLMRDRGAGQVVPKTGSAADLRRALAEVRRGGYAAGRATRPWALSTVAAPIHGPAGVVAALSIVAPIGELDAATHSIAVRAAARAISRQLTADSPT
jgi:DNA-binding IclR family transcriptional regulator